MNKHEQMDALEEGITDAIYDLTYIEGTLTLTHDEARKHAKRLIAFIRNETLRETSMANLPPHDIYLEDTLEGRRQADAIFNWLIRNHQSLLLRCRDHIQAPKLSEWDERQYMLDRIKWCLEELADE